MDRRNFDHQLANISPCAVVGSGFEFKEDVIYYSIKLHLMHVFMWEYETTKG